MREPFHSAIPVLKKLVEHGHKAYFVGGSVRDLMLNRKIGDIDIATSAKPEEVIKIFPKHIPVGIEHGTVMVEENGEHYEVTTFRTEGDYDDFRHPNKVAFITSIEEDLSRRDFTINSMAMDLNGKIIDPFNGKDDLENRIIRSVGNAKERFSEDPLRMMRAIRFVSQLSFSIESKTKEGIEEDGYLLKKIAVERIKVEFEKLLLGSSASSALQLMIDTKVYEYLPELAGKRNELTQFTKYNLQNLSEIKELWAICIYLLIKEDIDSFLRKWKTSKQLIHDVSSIINGLNDAKKEERWTKRNVYKLGRELSLSAARVYAVLNHLNINEQVILVNQLYDGLPINKRSDMDVKGTDLIQWFDKNPGPWIAEFLGHVELAIINGEIQNKKMEIKGWLETCNQK